MFGVKVADEVHAGSGTKPYTCTTKATSDENAGQREEHQRPWRRPHHERTNTPTNSSSAATPQRNTTNATAAGAMEQQTGATEGKVVRVLGRGSVEAWVRRHNPAPRIGDKLENNCKQPIPAVDSRREA